jgi:hypothetical protein
MNTKMALDFAERLRTKQDAWRKENPELKTRTCLSAEEQAVVALSDSLHACQAANRELVDLLDGANKRLCWFQDLEPLVLALLRAIGASRVVQDDVTYGRYVELKEFTSQAESSEMGQEATAEKPVNAGKHEDACPSCIAMNRVRDDARREASPVNAGDPLHPTGRHPEGGCGCADEGDPACPFHVPPAAFEHLRDQLIIRDMQLSTLRERLAAAEAKNDELRKRWDRAETEVERLRAAQPEAKPVDGESGLTPDRAIEMTDKLDTGIYGWDDVAGVLVDEVWRLRALVDAGKIRDELGVRELELRAERDRIRDQYASLCATLRVALADAERNLK